MQIIKNRKYSIGAEIFGDGSVGFRVWAPLRQKVTVELFADENQKEDPTNVSLEQDGNGYFSGIIDSVPPIIKYGFRLDDGEQLYPDPASRFQPSGSFGLSQLVDPSRFKWTDNNWRGIESEVKIIYEMHIGTFTSEGTWKAATKELPELARIGINTIELMPVAEFEGDFGWGYDGVNIFAPSHLYGSPDDFKEFINAAHNLGIGIILDVVYNHLGPGIFLLKEFSQDYFTKKYTNEWGQAINFDGEKSGPVREFILTNAHYWVEEFHIDGLRLDATQQIFDDSEKNIIDEICQTVQTAASGKKTFVVAENEPQNSDILRKYGIDAVWNDDFHHSAVVALTDHNEAYYSDYRGSPQEFVSLAKYGFLYQGQYYYWQKKPRGKPSIDFTPQRFIHYLQNHDQIANTCYGLRIHELTSPGRLRTFTALLILGPQIPLIFQGQEFGSSSPFSYFAHHNDKKLAESSKKGRERFLSQFASIKSVNGPLIPPPYYPEALTRCKLNLDERKTHENTYGLHADLIAIRKSEPVFRVAERKGIDGAVLGEKIFVIRYFGVKPENDRLLIVNYGKDHELSPCPEPLMAPPVSKSWKLIWYSEDPVYGGGGIPEVFSEGKWNIFGQCAYFLGS